MVDEYVFLPSNEDRHSHSDDLALAVVEHARVELTVVYVKSNPASALKMGVEGKCPHTPRPRQTALASGDGRGAKGDESKGLEHA